MAFFPVIDKFNDESGFNASGAPASSPEVVTPPLNPASPQTNNGQPTRKPVQTPGTHYDQDDPKNHKRPAIDLGYGNDTPISTDIAGFFKVFFAFMKGLFTGDMAEFDIYSAVYAPPSKDIGDRVERMQDWRSKGHKPSPDEIAGLTEGIPDEYLAKGGKKVVLDMIAKAEARSYDTVRWGHKVDLTAMTIGEVIEKQRTLAPARQAAGRYQFMPDTLEATAKREGVSLNAKFDESMQDRLAGKLVDDAGYNKYMAGKMDSSKFLYNLSKTWAGLPKDESELSYHEGKLNSATVSHDFAMGQLRIAKKVEEERNNPAHAEKPEENPEEKPDKVAAIKEAGKENTTKAETPPVTADSKSPSVKPAAPAG